MIDRHAPKTKAVRQKPTNAPPLDQTDRRLLGALAEDAGRSYADLGQLLHLSPPAVHERAKRLRTSGVIRGTVARLDPVKIGRPLLAFVHVDCGGWTKAAQVEALQRLLEVEEIHSVTGDSCVLLKVRTPNSQGLEDLLRLLHTIGGVKGTRSHVVLSTSLERGPVPA